MESIQDKLQVLKNSYRENLDGKRVELSALFEQALDGWEPDQLGKGASHPFKAKGPQCGPF